MVIGKKIKELRAKQNLTQGALALKLGCSQQAVGQWESGVASPRVEQLPRIAELLHCKIDDLFEEVNEDAGDEAEQKPV